MCIYIKQTNFKVIFVWKMKIKRYKSWCLYEERWFLGEYPTSNIYIYRWAFWFNNTVTHKEYETVKTTLKSINTTIWRFNQDFCFKHSFLMSYILIWQRKKQVYKSLGIPNIRESTVRDKFCTIVSEVSSLVGNPV